MPVFALPIALLGLAALPGVAVIYMLRTRSRRRVVSSLMLWADQRRARAGGVRFQRIQTPLILLLELLTVALLVLAAAGPRGPTGRNIRPLIVVLDDSYSMRAGGENSPRARGRLAIAAEFETARHSPVQFVLAGIEPRVLGRPARTAERALEALDDWACDAPAADIAAATGLAESLSTARDAAPKARILVITDHAPPGEIDPGDTRWRAFGQARDNVAFTAAVRSRRGGRPKCLIEVANFSADRQSAAVSLDGLAQAEPHTLDLAAGATGTLRLNLPDADATVGARLADDGLDVDNVLTLLPQPQRIVRVDLAVTGATLRKSLQRAIDASGRTIITTERPALLITDQPSARLTARETWVVQFLAESDASAYVGPFVVDRAHPLTDGLSLAGLVWAAGKTTDLPGRPVIAAGNVPLITELRMGGGRREIRIRLRSDISTLLESTNWPVLVWNLLKYRASALEGLWETNVRLGGSARLALTSAARSVTVTGPAGRVTKAPVADGSAAIEAPRRGVYTVQAGAAKYQFAANALSPAESDLRKCVSGDWGDWLSARALATEYMPVAWLLVLAAMACMVAHAVIISHVARARRTARPNGGGT